MQPANGGTIDITRRKFRERRAEHTSHISRPLAYGLWKKVFHDG